MGDFHPNRINRNSFGSVKGTSMVWTPATPFRLDYLPRLPRNKDVAIGCVGAGFIMDECQLVAYRAAGFRPVAISSRTLLADSRVEVVDIAVPPDVQIDVVREAVRHASHVRGILAQKPLGVNFS